MFKRREREEKPRATLTVSRKSWHGRLYLRWKELGGDGKRYGYRENLCHYCRVVVIWAPLRWFIATELLGFEWLRPILVAGVAVVLIALIAVTVLWPMSVLLGLGIVLAAAVAMTALWFLISWLDNHSEEIGTGFTWVGRRVADIGWFWLAIPTAAYTLGWFLWPHIMLLITLGAIGAIIAAFAVYGIGLGVYTLWNDVLDPWNDDRKRRKPVKVKKEKAPKDDSFRKVAWEYSVARKHRICPFISLDES